MYNIYIYIYIKYIPDLSRNIAKMMPALFNNDAKAIHKQPQNHPSLQN